MLPAELLTLILIASSALALPQAWVPLTANATSSRTGDPTNPQTSPPQVTETSSGTGGPATTWSEECTDGCTFICTGSCAPVDVQFGVTETGFENTNTDVNGRTTLTTSEPGTRPATKVNVVTTSAPLIVGIQTSVAPTAVYLPPADSNVQPAPTAEGSQTWGQDGPNAPEATPANSLLTNIISNIARPQPNPSVPSDNQLSPGNGDPQQMQQGTTEASSPSMTAAPGAQPTVALGQSMTLAGTIVTLTPGLSTTVGTGPAATYIEIISDNAGQTMITLSSSGTAVTATVTNAPITITVASDFDTSITQAATPGGPESSGTGAVASSSSEAGAVDITYGTNWLVNIAIGIVGLGAALR